MKIVFLSNFFNHHQSALSDALWQKTNGNFAFVETGEMPEERKLLGYTPVQKPYILPLKGREREVEQWIRDADVVVTGSAPERLIWKRVRAGKLVFRYAERPLKKGLEAWKYGYRRLLWHWCNPPGKPVYMLCAGAYTAGDYRRFDLFKNRAYKWGYFPETKRYTDIHGLLAAAQPAEILWCGRFLDWKHPEEAVKAVQRLKKDGYECSLKFIGRGEMEDTLRQMVREGELDDCVRFSGAMSPEQVRGHMEKAGIYLFTSGRQEGWGAVLNEAMNSGCAVIASHATGAAPFLIQDKENGLIYRCGDVDMLYEQIRYLLDHPQEQKRLGGNAYDTITGKWNGEIAAQRLLALSQAVLSGEKCPDLYESGPCSRAEIWGDDWM